MPQIIVPMISARIEAINNKKPKEIIDENNKSFWFINGERRISWVKDPPINNPITKGKCGFRQRKDSKILLDFKVASDLNLRNW